MRARLSLASLLAVLAALFLALPSGAVTTSCGAPVVSAGTATVTCGYTGEVQTWTVPQGVTSASFDVQGAQGGSGGGAGGSGGRAVDTLTVIPGAVVDVRVGGDGENGGFNGGGSGGASVGGGASDIRIGGSALSDRVLVAGGGGGGGLAPNGSGGGGGGLTGEDGTLGCCATGGAGGNQDGTTGSGLLGSGGSSLTGGGGGGGYWGGEAGQMGAAGGGGGSGFGPADVTFTTGYRTGDGQVLITYTAPSYVFTGFAPPIKNLPAVNSAKAGQPVAVKWNLQLTDGTPVSDPGSFTSLTTEEGCPGSPPDNVETFVGGSGLQYLGGGDWQFNWKTPQSYAGQCRTMILTLADGSTHTAAFQFK